MSRLGGRSGGTEVGQPVEFILGLLVFKFLATTITVGFGTVGGVFTPTLFLGAGLGGLFGCLLHHSQLGVTHPTGEFALFGMGRMLPPSTYTPLLSFIMIF